MKTENGLYKEVEKIFSRNERKALLYEAKYSGKEGKLTFHAGWKLGYWEGGSAALSDLLDILEDYGMKPTFDLSLLDVVRRDIIK